MTEALTESFCERCGTRYEFKAPTRLNPLRKTRGLIGGLKNFLTSDDDFSDAIGDAMRDEEGALATAQLEAFHQAFNFCIDCRQYTCLSCWNDDAGRCRTCVPVPGADDLAERLAASVAAAPMAVAGVDEATMSPEEVQHQLGLEAWPTSDLPDAPAEPAVAASSADDAWVTTPGVYAATPPPAPAPATPAPLAPTGGFVGADGFVYDTQEQADAVAAQMEADAAALAAAEQARLEAEAHAALEAQAEADALAATAALEMESQPVAAVVEPEPEPEPVAAEAPELEPEPVAEAAQEREAEPIAAVGPEPEPAPVAAEAPAEPPRLRVVAWDEDAALDLEPEPVVAVAPEPKPEPVATVEAQPEPVAAEAPRYEPVVGETAPLWPAQAEPEPVAAEIAPEPEPEPVAAVEAEPEPVAAVAPEPEPQPEPMAASTTVEPEPAPTPLAPRLAPISETILHFPERPAPEPIAAAAEDETPEVAARRAQLDLLGLGDPGEGPVHSDRAAVLPYRSRGAAVTQTEIAMRAAAGARFWEASAREVAGAVGNIGVQNCGQCGLSLSANARFCRRCGTRQAQPA